jgi:hypothetical protein
MIGYSKHHTGNYQMEQSFGFAAREKEKGEHHRRKASHRNDVKNCCHIAPPH